MCSVIASSAWKSFKSPIFHSKIFTVHALKNPSINHKRNMSSSASGDLGIENTNIKTASGVSLDETQQTLVGSILDVRWHLKPMNS